MPEPAGQSPFAFLGLGHMGAPMAARLVAAGFDLIGYDIAPARVADLAGLTLAANPAAAVSGCRTVVLMLPTSEAVAAVVEEITPSLTPDALVVDMGSTDPLLTRELEGRLAAAGRQLVDAPVSGGVVGAVGGTLTIMVGGPASTVEGLAPLLKPLGQAHHVGPVGAGHALKALNNLMSAAHLMVTSEALVAGRRFGLEVETMLDVMNSSSGRSGSTETKWPKFILPGTYDSGFTAELMVKDVRTAVRLIESTGLVDVLSADVLGAWTAALDGLPPHADHTEVARWLDR